MKTAFESFLLIIMLQGGNTYANDIDIHINAGAENGYKIVSHGNDIQCQRENLPKNEAITCQVSELLMKAFQARLIFQNNNTNKKCIVNLLKSSEGYQFLSSCKAAVFDEKTMSINLP